MAGLDSLGGHPWKCYIEGGLTEAAVLQNSAALQMNILDMTHLLISRCKVVHTYEIVPTSATCRISATMST